ncbi:Skp1 family, dimerization domain-containing protein [Annulohypoxylon truncatum]|uniref:Skp1 family, dimerization domain-containing protein n=1 Tax=Annulohypoxylon truncatum TaxID=327061 RepID=UPI002008E6F5|nr:Skp1 family, dimerization domain-containing protein [Annulohypoxylon truncatum]KAI1204834.1 Skp1 family, dimerization domain-containing protein [Annulohypoxylon truncatum]
MGILNVLTLAAHDGTQVIITHEAAKQSAILKDMMEDLPEEETNVPVPIAAASGESLKMIVEWCEHRVLEEKEEQEVKEREMREKEEQELALKKKQEEDEKQAASKAASSDSEDSDDSDEDSYDAETDSYLDTDSEFDWGFDSEASFEPTPNVAPPLIQVSPPPFEVPAYEAALLAPLSQAQLFELLTAANFLDIPLLLKCAAKIVAEKIRGMTTEQMREYFGIENDFTAEEEAQIRREHGWAFLGEGDDYYVSPRTFSYPEEE